MPTQPKMANALINCINKPVLQGETAISSDPNVVMTTILGSCISACIWDPVAGIGGMNHFLLPTGDGSNSTSLGFGINTMELLLNGLIVRGADRNNLRVHIFGGAKMYDGGPRIGEHNAEFARWFLENEGLDCDSTCVGGTLGRKIRFWPATGQAQRKFITDVRNKRLDFAPALRPPLADTRPKDGIGDVELF